MANNNRNWSERELILAGPLVTVSLEVFENVL